MDADALEYARQTVDADTLEYSYQTVDADVLEYSCQTEVPELTTLLLIFVFPERSYSQHF